MINLKIIKKRNKYNKRNNYKMLFHLYINYALY